MKKTLTTEQIEKRDARKARFRVLLKEVANTPELERIALANKMGFITVDGHALSLCNSMLIALQCPTASILGGFRQWLKHGRCVRKGEHGAMIWVPTGGKNNDRPLDGSTSNSAVVDANPAGDGESTRFVIGTLFDIGQTEESTGETETEETTKSTKTPQPIKTTVKQTTIDYCRDKGML